MKKQEPNSATTRVRLSDALISQALNEAVCDAVEIHRQAGLPLAVWQEGKVALVPAEKVKSRRNGTKSKPRKKKPKAKRV